MQVHPQAFRAAASPLPPIAANLKELTATNESPLTLAEITARLGALGALEAEIVGRLSALEERVKLSEDSSGYKHPESTTADELTSPLRRSSHSASIFRERAS